MCAARQKDKNKHGCQAAADTAVVIGLFDCSSNRRIDYTTYGARPIVFLKPEIQTGCVNLWAAFAGTLVSDERFIFVCRYV